LYAIQFDDEQYFVDIGGVNYYDINFDIKSTGGFPLRLAAARGSESFVRLMLQNKTLDVNKKDVLGTNSFWIAARFGHGGVMRLLAENGADVLNFDNKGYNALHIAAKNGYDNVVKMLIASNYPLNA
jgi:ankyrin repeat protein